MRRIALLLCGLVLFAGLVAGCQPSASAQDARLGEFDEAIHEVEHEFAAYYLLGRDASVSDIQSRTKQLTAEWDKVEAAAEGLDGVDLGEATAAHDALADAVQALPEGAEDGQAMTSVMPKFEAFKAALEEVHESAGLHDE